MTKLKDKLSFIRVSVLLTVLLGLSFTIEAATIYSKAVTGAWDNTNSWVGGVIPTENDDVVIVTGSTITVPSGYTTAEAKSVTVQGSATLFINSGAKLTVYGNVNVNNNGTLSLDSNGNDAGFLVVYGNYTNQGTTNIGKGNIIVALDYTDSHVTIQNLGNLVVGGQFVATIDANGGPSIYIINDPTPSITSTNNNTVTYTNVIPSTESAELRSIVSALITDPSCNITLTGPSLTVSGCEGQTVTLSVTPVQAGSYTYRWQIYTGAEFTDITGATSSTLTLSNVTFAMNNNKYRCKVTSSGTTSCTKTSAYATLTVNPSVSVGVTIVASLNNQCEGTPITFSISSLSNEGSAPAYQWLVKDVPKATTATYTYNPVNGDKVQLKVTSDVSCATNPGMSNVLDMVMYPLPPPNPIVSN